MDKILISFLIFFSFHTLLKGQTLRLLDIVQEPSSKVAVVANLNERGGDVSFTRTYPNGCIGGYKVNVTFSKSLNMLQPGETFQVTLNCEDCSSSCNYKWKFVSVFGANNITSIEQFPNYVFNENFEYLGSSNGSMGVNYWEPGMRSNIITLKYDPKKDVPLTAFQINVAGEHAINFVYQSDTQETDIEPIIGKPNLSCAWKSTYGNIYWGDGYYGSSSNTLSGELIQRGEKWVFEGTWGRVGSSRWGRVFFTFNSPTSFIGYWTEGEGTNQTKWEGTGECLLIKR